MPFGNEYEDTVTLNPWSDRRESRSVQRIEHYWEELRASRLLPLRSEVDPRALDGVLGNAFVLERIAPGLARFRIAGSHIVEFTGLELRQMPASVLFGIHSRRVLADALETVFNEPAAVHMHLMSKGGYGRADMQGEMVLLPLRGESGEVDRVLGGLAMLGDVGRKPRRLDITSQARKTLTGFAGTLPNAPRPRVVSESLSPIKSEPSSREHLRLVVTNDS